MNNNLNSIPPSQGKTGWPWTDESTPLPNKMQDGSPWPKISIVTPSYNQAQYLEETIRSVLLQNYPNLEYIIIDGGSTDNSVEIIKKYEPWLAYWNSERDRGQSQAINKGFSIATGELAGWLNSDDIFFPGAINKVVTYWTANNKPEALITGTKLKGDSNLQTISRLEQFPFTIQHLINKNIIEQPSTFYPVSLLRKVGCIDERYRMSMDYDLWLRMAKQGIDLVFLNEDLAITRIHSSAKTTRFQRRSLTEVMLSVWRNFHVVSKPWLKKFLTVWIVPEGVKSKFWKRILFIIRNGLLKFTVVILEIMKLLESNIKFDNIDFNKNYKEENRIS